MQFSCVRVDLPLAHNDSFIFQPAPCTNIGFVILVGDNYFITWLEFLAQRLRDHIGVLRSGRAEVDFFRINVQPGRHALLRGIHLHACCRGSGKIVIGLNLGLPVVTIQPLNGLPAGIRSACVLEQSETFE